jgi:hypothetical protein
MHGSSSKIPSKKCPPYIYDVKFLALLGAAYIDDISRLRVKGEQDDATRNKDHHVTWETCLLSSHDLSLHET